MFFIVIIVPQLNFQCLVFKNVISNCGFQALVNALVLNISAFADRFIFISVSRNSRKLIWRGGRRATKLEKDKLESLNDEEILQR